ncbi:hypothetical protein BABINDRAFT_117572 [Babjeviella inositovora NRRL Y-12698]|uniref:Uncharacterized protein n=1 Tax=Babjeviella inositovora NRRL Y-12698 TaxID=984486 RepID=A0A1E3QGY6_9ASCO|nr:uncharacterized protein BABINDRAFT_117572 [Babjeviella inositovora NRRL Y-12698]ODQ76956.1 hypothetical protein BABINDRAFT_117572 [Babjeviella inositovora NRRL Y-12698]
MFIVATTPLFYTKLRNTSDTEPVFHLYFLLCPLFSVYFSSFFFFFHFFSLFFIIFLYYPLLRVHQTRIKTCLRYLMLLSRSLLPHTGHRKVRLYYRTC